MSGSSLNISNENNSDHQSDNNQTIDQSHPSIIQDEKKSAKEIINKSLFENKSDTEIWETFKNGNESAFIYIYSRYFNELINYGYQYTTNVAFIEDCVQDLFIKLRKSRNKLGVIKKSIRLYLIISLKRRLLKRKKKPNGRYLLEIELSEEFEIVLPKETHLIQEDIFTERTKSLQKAMNHLTRKQREAIYYIYYNNLSITEAKEIMKINSEKTLRNLLYRALGSMRSIMNYMSVFALLVTNAIYLISY